MRSVQGLCVLLAAAWLGSFGLTECDAVNGEPPSVSLERSQIAISYLAHDYALETSSEGVPVFDLRRWVTRPREVVTHQVPAVILQNAFFRATLIPAAGRLHSFLNRQTGNESLWINSVAVPLGANNDTHFWMTWGGIEHVLPRREHGTSHALTWTSTLWDESPAQKSVQMTVTEPLTGLLHTVVYTAYADKPYLETTLTIENPSPRPVKFSHWTTALYAPGPKDEVTERTEIIIPADELVPDKREFNDWMRPLAGPANRSPLRFAGNWTSLGDLMTSELKESYYAVYCHEAQEGVVRTFDRSVTPGLDVWSWGYPASNERQREFTAGGPNNGYVEVWNGTTRGFEDEDLGELPAGGRISWRETLSLITGVSDSQSVRDEVRKIAAAAQMAAEERSP